MRASFSISAPVAQRLCDRRQAIAACSVRMGRFRARRSNPVPTVDVPCIMCVGSSASLGQRTGNLPGGAGADHRASVVLHLLFTSYEDFEPYVLGHASLGHDVRQKDNLRNPRGAYGAGTGRLPVTGT